MLAGLPRPPRAAAARRDARAGRRSIAEPHRSYLSPKSASEGTARLYRRLVRCVTL